MKNLEKRLLQESAECRAFRDDDGEMYIEGWALKFNSRSKDLGGFTEILAPNALDNTDMSDVLVRINHSGDISNVVGRSGVNLELDVREEGLWYRTLLDKDSQRDQQLYSDVSRGLISSSSFAFTVAPDGDDLEVVDDVLVRTVNSIERLYDVAPVHNPAYEDATVSARSLESVEDFKKELEKRSKPEDDDSKKVKEALNVDDNARLRLLKQK